MYKIWNLRWKLIEEKERMSETMSAINIEAIMKEIREEIEAAGYTDSMLSFDDVALDDANFQFATFSKSDFKREVSDLNQRWSIQTYRNLGTSGFGGFIKKVIRKCIRFYVDPVVEDQNRFNANVVKTMNLMNCYIQEQDATIAVLKKQIEKLEEQKEQ